MARRAGPLEAAIEKLSGERVTVTVLAAPIPACTALDSRAFDLERPFEAGRCARRALNHYLGPDPSWYWNRTSPCNNSMPVFRDGAAYLFLRILNRRAPPALEHGKVWLSSSRWMSEACTAGQLLLLGQLIHHLPRREFQAQSPSRP